MKRLFIAALLLATLLSGCAAKIEPYLKSSSGPAPRLAEQERRSATSEPRQVAMHDLLLRLIESNARIESLLQELLTSLDGFPAQPGQIPDGCPVDHHTLVAYAEKLFGDIDRDLTVEQLREAKRRLRDSIISNYPTVYRYDNHTDLYNYRLDKIVRRADNLRFDIFINESKPPACIRGHLWWAEAGYVQ